MPIVLDLTAEEESDFLNAIARARATELSDLRSKERNLMAYGDRGWADTVRSEVPLMERRIAVLDKVTSQIGDQP